MLVSGTVIFLGTWKPHDLDLIDWNSFGGLKSQNIRQTHFRFTHMYKLASDQNGVFNEKMRNPISKIC